MGYRKFNGSNYWNDFYKHDIDLYSAIKDHLRSIKNDSLGIDLGAGPGVGAKLLDELGTKTELIGYEPSDSADNNIIKELKKKKSKVNFTIVKKGIKDVAATEYDYCLILRAAHEIADSLGSRKAFFVELRRILSKMSKRIIIADPYYSYIPTKKSIKKIQKYQQESMGHFHKPNDYINPNIMQKELSGLGYQLIKETIVKNKKIEQMLAKEGLKIDNPCNFYVQSYTFSTESVKKL